MIERWLVAIRDHPDRPPAAQRLVLHSLALRMDWLTGRGFASVEQLGADADAGKSTVIRATGWARRSALLVRTRRGHRIDAERKVASEWQLTQGVTPDTLATQGVNGSDPRCQQDRPKVSPQTHHQESSSSKSSSSLSARACALLRAADPEVSERETEFIIEKIKLSGGRNVLAIVRKNITDGDAPALIGDARIALAEAEADRQAEIPAAGSQPAIQWKTPEEIARGEQIRRAALADMRSTLSGGRPPACDRDGPGSYSEACRAGDGKFCRWSWCECSCHPSAKGTP